ncbi:hypothetical protein KKB18_01350, partial [bacterium]|nr:hypothetical protein [bacterium]
DDVLASKDKQESHPLEAVSEPIKEAAEVAELDISEEFESIEGLKFNLQAITNDLDDEISDTLNDVIASQDKIKTPTVEAVSELIEEAAEVVELDISEEFVGSEGLEFDLQAAAGELEDEISDKLDDVLTSKDKTKTPPTEEAVSELIEEAEEVTELDLSEELEASEGLEFDLQAAAGEIDDEISDKIEDLLEPKSVLEPSELEKVSEPLEEILELTDLDVVKESEAMDEKEFALPEAEGEVKDEKTSLPDSLLSPVESPPDVEITGVEGSEAVHVEEEVLLLEDETSGRDEDFEEIVFEETTSEATTIESEEHILAETFFTDSGKKVDESIPEEKVEIPIELSDPREEERTELFEIPGISDFEEKIPVESKEGIEEQVRSMIPSEEEIRKMVLKIVNERIELIIEETMWEIIPDLTEQIIRRKIEENKG